MNLQAAVCTTFPNDSWNVYSKRMLESFMANWPEEVPIMVRLDDAKLSAEVNKILRPADGLVSGWEKDHADFVARNKGKDDPQDYRKQAVRFCHKVFAIRAALDAVNRAKADKAIDVPRYLIWLDADVLTTRKVMAEDLLKCMPKDGDAVSYMGRKDWDHSECGWLAFDLENGGNFIIEEMIARYIKDEVFKHDQWHDSWIFDSIIKMDEFRERGVTNLTPNATGMEVWPQSPMASWSRHYKGPIAKMELSEGRPPKQSNMQPLKIQTQNSIPNDNIQRNILENQAQIKNWITPCKVTSEEIVVVSAGPMLIAEDLLDEMEAGRKIVAVKHALKPLKEAGIKPWACILLDPRDHVYDFVENPDIDILWFVASQVTPKAVKKLLDAGCNVWGYHASVGAGETKYTEKQEYAVVDGGSATATRGLHMLEKLGFRKFRLYGYDLCLAQKPNLSEKDEMNQPKFFEIEVGYQLSHHKDFRWFWSKGELLAQADEFRQILEQNKWQIRAFGPGIAPFLANTRRVNDLRIQEKLRKMPRVKPVNYEELFKCRNKAQSLTHWLMKLLKIPRKPRKASSF